jgi:hypothetical protein
VRTQQSLLFLQILMLLCASGAVGNSVDVQAPQNEALPNLTVTIDIARANLLSKPDEPYRVGPDVHINVTAKNESSERLNIIVTNPFAQNGPHLVRNGKLVPYLEEVNKLIREKETSPDWAHLNRTDYITLQPYESAKIDFLDLKDWYGPLTPGSYQLTNRYRFRARAPWSNESKAVSFEVVAEGKK